MTYCSIPRAIVFLWSLRRACNPIIYHGFQVRTGLLHLSLIQSELIEKDNSFFPIQTFSYQMLLTLGVVVTATDLFEVSYTSMELDPHTCDTMPGNYQVNQEMSTCISTSLLPLSP